MLNVIPPTYGVRATIPARELLQDYGNHVRAVDGGSTVNVTLIRPPNEPMLVVCMTIYDCLDIVSLRTETEPPFPRELTADWASVGAFVPCPECGAALVWFEAGYVPGYRICLRGHHCQLSDDGSFAELSGKETKTDLTSEKAWKHMISSKGAL